jgi:hypothetical protein
VAEEVRELLAAVSRLPELEREVLLLVAWGVSAPSRRHKCSAAAQAPLEHACYRARHRLAADRRLNVTSPRASRRAGNECVLPTVEELRPNA